MKKEFRHLFEPFTVRRMTVKNRIMMTPMGTNYGEQNGEMSFLHINYYEQRAKGGTGLIMVENASVDSPEGSNGTTQLRIDHDNYIPRLFKLTETIHKHGTCIGIQLNHAGASAQWARTNMQPVSASDIPSKEGGDIPRPLEKDEIMRIVKKYGEAAKRAQTAGFDCVEIHAGHSYLLSQFLSPLTNKRTDEFGGSPENRARFARLVMEEVRRQVGPFFPIFLRISADEFMEGGNTLDDCLDYLQYIQEEADVIDVSCGLNGSIQYQIDSNHFPDGWRSYMARAVKDRYNKPCVTMGNIRDPHVAEDILARGDADLIGIGRGLIADPEWVNKVEFGDICDIRKCISFHRTTKLKNLFTFTNMEADVDFIRSLKPNIIVNATGSSPLLPPISGLHENLGKEGSKVYTILDMIAHLGEYPEDMTGKKVVVIGGGAVGLDVVEYFAPRGADVSIVEMLPIIGNGIDPVSKVDINTLMNKYGVKQIPSTALKEVRPDNFLVEAGGEQKELPFDYGFVCLGMKAEHPVLQNLRDAFGEDDQIEIVNIGDSVRARRIIDGTEEGRNILNTLERRGYL